jgi:FAD/FMN-containing dehydrogenase
MLGNNSCGVHSVLAEFYGPGPTSAHQVEKLEILTYDRLRAGVGSTPPDVFDGITRSGGRRAVIYEDLRQLRDRCADEIRGAYRHIPRRVSGYNLAPLLDEEGFQVARALVGSENTCVTILEATVRLIPNPPSRSLLVLGYSSIYEAGDHVPEIREHKPIGLEGMDNYLIRYIRRNRLHPEAAALLPEGEGWLLVEFGGANKREADDQARALMERLKKSQRSPSMKLFDNPPFVFPTWPATF